MKKLLSKRPQTVPIFIKKNAFDCSLNTCIKQATCLVHVRIVFSSLSHPLKKIEMTHAMICRSAHSLLGRARGADQKYVERDDVRPRPACAGEILKRINRRAIWICVWGNLGLRNHVIIVMSSLSKSSVFKTWCFLSTLKHKSGVFKFLRFKERFLKAPFLRPISVDGRPNHRKKAAFSNFSGGSVDGCCLIFKRENSFSNEHSENKKQKDSIASE